MIHNGHYKLDIGGYNYWMDGWYYENLNVILKEAIPYNWDALLIFHGKEGAGKTTMAVQTMLMLDHSFDIDNTVFLPNQFEKAIDDALPETSILWDEAITGANAAAWANSVSQSVISKLTQIRKKKLKIGICFPYIWMLNKYFVSRCVSSVYIYSKGFKKRGNAYFYNQKQTEDLYSVMKEKYRLKPRLAFKICRKSFYFKFAKQFCLPENEYDHKKENARVSDEGNDNIIKKRFAKLINLVRQKVHLKEVLRVNDAAEHVGMTPHSFRQFGKYHDNPKMKEGRDVIHI